jgi:SAM-dependent methyltransferase
MTLRSDVLSACAWERPCADLCCGDGLFSFLHRGGELDPAFDVFWPTAAAQEALPAGRDMFDHHSDAYAPPIRVPAAEPVDLGTDVKPSLLSKASRLNLYGRLVRHDHNEPLPFASASFRFVYCNAAYWVRNIDAFLRELGRIVEPGGKVVLHVKLDAFHKVSLNAHRRVLGPRFLERIVGDRLRSWPTLAGRRTWESRFRSARLVIDGEAPFITETHLRLWEVGLRPIAPLLMRMANAIDAKTRAAIKQEWVALLIDLTAPFCDPGFSLSGSASEPGEIQYVLVPR